MFDFILYVPVNNSSVMSGRVFLGGTSTKQRLLCLAQGHNTVTLSSNPRPLGLKSSTLPLSHCASRKNSKRHGCWGVNTRSIRGQYFRNSLTEQARIAFSRDLPIPHLDLSHFALELWAASEITLVPFNSRRICC